MSLTSEQIDFIGVMDTKAKQILRQGGQKELLMSLPDIMEKIKGIMDCSTKNELNYYCEKYEGFYHYMKLLEQIAQASAAGEFRELL